MKFLSSYATPQNFVHLIDFKKRYLWIAYSKKVPIGFFDFEIEDLQKGYLVLYIIPAYRGKGLGYNLLNKALMLDEVRKVEVLKGGVEKENIASRRTLEKCGFTYAYTDEEGMFMYQRRF